MAMNRVQLQRGMSLSDFLRKFETKKQCIQEVKPRIFIFRDIRRQALNIKALQLNSHFACHIRLVLRLGVKDSGSSLKYS